MTKLKKTIGIIGYGFVGRAVGQMSEVFDVNVFDPYIEEHSGYDVREKAYVSDFVFVCVPTPEGSDGKLDTSIVDGAAHIWNNYNHRSLHGNRNSILVIKSTIEPGTVDSLRSRMGRTNIVHNPEFLTQRTAMEDFRNPLEVIVGGDPTVARRVLDLFYSYYPINSDIKFFATSAMEAELVKMVRNSFYATKVSFFNEVHELCGSLGLDYEKFRDLFTLGGTHPWVARQHTQVPGPDGQLGYGGICLPKDSEGLLYLAESAGVDLSVLGAAIASNSKRREK